MEKRRSTSSSSELDPEAQNNVPYTRCGGPQTPESIEYAPTSPTILLVARRRRMGKKIRRQLRAMPQQTANHQDDLPDNTPITRENPRSTGTPPHHIKRMENHALDRGERRLAKERSPGNSPRRNAQTRNTAFTS